MFQKYLSVKLTDGIMSTGRKKNSKKKKKERQQKKGKNEKERQRKNISTFSYKGLR